MTAYRLAAKSPPAIAISHTAGVVSAIFCPPAVSTFASDASTGTGGNPSSSGALPKKSHAAAMPIAPIAAAPQKQLRQA